MKINEQPTDPIRSSGCLSIISWNCNSLKGKKEFGKEHALDILLLKETHLRPGITFRITNYTILRNDYVKRNSMYPIRGTAVWVKYNHIFLPAPPPVNPNVVRAIGISIKYPNFNLFSCLFTCWRKRV